jgi:hypothetical protein
MILSDYLDLVNSLVSAKIMIFLQKATIIGRKVGFILPFFQKTETFTVASGLFEQAHVKIRLSY